MLISDVRVDPGNVRAHSERNLEAIKTSLLKFGQRKPIVVGRDDIVQAGNGTVAAARALGWERVAVVRSPLKGSEATAYSIADNRTSELAEWDESALAKALGSLKNEDGIDELATGFNEKEIERLLAQDQEVIEDAVPEVPEKPITKPGDLWLLGEHRVLCGDSTKVEDVARVMDDDKAQMVFTDPPYGVDYDGGTTAREKLIGDHTTALYMSACKMAAMYSSKNAPLYLWHAGTKGIAAAAAAAGYEIRCELVWNKNQAQFGALSAQYKQKHEPCYYCHKRGKAPQWFGPTNEVTVWDHDRAPRNEYHPTQKPVALAVRAAQNSSIPGQIILDLFLGSGTTLIAAEQLGRKCYGLEIEPKYCDVIVKRWENLTGKKAKVEHG